MAYETANHPNFYMAVPLEPHLHSTNLSSLCWESAWCGCIGNNLAYAATQGKSILRYISLHTNNYTNDEMINYNYLKIINSL